MGSIPLEQLAGVTCSRFVMHSNGIVAGPIQKLDRMQSNDFFVHCVCVHGCVLYTSIHSHTQFQTHNIEHKRNECSDSLFNKFYINKLCKRNEITTMNIQQMFAQLPFSVFVGIINMRTSNVYLKPLPCFPHAWASYAHKYNAFTTFNEFADDDGDCEKPTQQERASLQAVQQATVWQWPGVGRLPRHALAHVKNKKYIKTVSHHTQNH